MLTVTYTSQLPFPAPLSWTHLLLRLCFHIYSLCAVEHIQLLLQCWFADINLHAVPCLVSIFRTPHIYNVFLWHRNVLLAAITTQWIWLWGPCDVEYKDSCEGMCTNFWRMNTWFTFNNYVAPSRCTCSEQDKHSRFRQWLCTLSKRSIDGVFFEVIFVQPCTPPPPHDESLGKGCMF